MCYDWWGCRRRSALFYVDCLGVNEAILGPYGFTVCFRFDYVPTPFKISEFRNAYFTSFKILYSIFTFNVYCFWIQIICINDVWTGILKQTQTRYVCCFNPLRSKQRWPVTGYGLFRFWSHREQRSSGNSEHNINLFKYAHWTRDKDVVRWTPIAVDDVF